MSTQNLKTELNQFHLFGFRSLDPIIHKQIKGPFSPKHQASLPLRRHLYEKKVQMQSISLITKKTWGNLFRTLRIRKTRLEVPTRPVDSPKTQFKLGNLPDFERF